MVEPNFTCNVEVKASRNACEIFKEGAPTPRKLETRVNNRKTINYELTSPEALRVLLSKVTKRKAVEEKQKHKQSAAEEKKSAKEKWTTTEKNTKSKREGETKKKKLKLIAKEQKIDLNNICVNCGFSYGDADDPLLEESWVQCGKCTRWMHDACSMQQGGKKGKKHCICVKCNAKDI